MTGATNRRDLLAADRAARRLAQTEFTAPLVLEAGAGTGKTTTLVARVLAWALSAGWETARREVAEREPERASELDRIAAAVLEGIVAITFTEAAAAEMESRVAEALSRAAAGEASEIVGFEARGIDSDDGVGLEERAHALLAALDHLTVRTIHAYCLSLLKRYPLEAGLHPDLVVDADGAILEELVGEVVEAGLRTAYTRDDDGPLIRLARYRIGPRRIAQTLRLLAERGVVSSQLDQDPFGPERVAELLDRLRAPLDRFHVLLGDRLDGLPPKQIAPKVARAVVATLDLCARLDEAAELSLRTIVDLSDSLADLWPKNRLTRLGSWSKGRFTGAEEKALAGLDGLGEAAGELRAALQQFQRLDPLLLDPARRALAGLLAQVEREMRARGVITFNGLLLEARRLLAEERSVRRRERGQLRQLLVDEFQDTDQGQCDLVRLLALSGSPSDRPGLFVVGDPKQSIYGWRNADLDAYEQFLQAVVEAGGERHSLVENFRSAAPILTEVDRSIAPVMTPIAGLQPGYERLVPCEALVDDPGFDRAERAPIEFWVSWARADDTAAPCEEKTHVDRAARLEAEAIARDIFELRHETAAEWSDFAVLLRSGGRLDTFLAAFRDAGVPFAVARDKSYFQRREIIEAAALVRAVVNPVDHLALLTFLRSPAVGLPDAAIIPLWQRQYPDLLSGHDRPSKALLGKLRKLVREVVGELPADIPGLDAIKGWDKSLLAGTETLLRLRESFALDPADRFIEHVRSWLLLEATEAARYLGSFRVANLERFLRNLETALDRSGGDIQSVLRSLRRGVAEAREAEEAVPKEAALDAVQFLTIHAAKGLEFKHVYLAQLHAGARKSDDGDVAVDERWTPGEPFEYRLFGAPTPGFDRVAERRQRVEDAERVRLLYVAMTRARQRLVLLGKWPATPAPVDESRRERFVDLLGSRRPLPPSIAALAPDEFDLERGVGAAEALWYFPGYVAPAAGGRRAFELPDWLPGPDAVRSSAAHLRELQGAAAKRMERPFHLAATHEAGERLAALGRESGLRLGVPATARETAMRVGTAIHRMFETWRLEADPKAELRRQRARIEADLEASLAADVHAEALERAGELLDRIEGGGLLTRFLELRDRIVARELAVALPPAAGGDGPVGFLSGAIDLVYRTRDGRLVIVDYKTDALELELEIETRAAEYADQERIYAEALHSALGLPEPPACELWFLWPDRLHRVAAGPP